MKIKTDYDGGCDITAGKEYEVTEVLFKLTDDTGHTVVATLGRPSAHLNDVGHFEIVSDQGNNPEIPDSSDDDLGKDFFNKLCSIFGIGDEARSESVLYENIKNASRRSSCLSVVERLLTVTKCDEDGEYEYCPLSWGDSPESYAEKFQPIADIYLSQLEQSKIAESDAEYGKRYRSLMDNGLICGTCGGVGMVGNALDSDDCPDCTGKHNDEIDQLRAEVERLHNLKIAADALARQFRSIGFPAVGNVCAETVDKMHVLLSEYEALQEPNE